MRSVLPTGRGRRHFRRGPAAIVLPALAAALGPSSASAATRHVWVGAAPAKWNAVPNGRDVLHGTRFGPGATTFPTVVYRRYTRRLAQTAAAGVRGGRQRRQFHGPADPRARRRPAPDPLQEHGHATRARALDALPRRRVQAFVGRDLAAAVLRQGRQRQAGPELHLPPHGRAGLCRLLALPRPLASRWRSRSRAACSAGSRSPDATRSAPTASTSSRSRPGAAFRPSTGARSSATRRCSRRASGRTCSGT